MRGGDGNDFLVGGYAHDFIDTGAAGGGTVYHILFDEVGIGGHGNDVIYGGPGVDNIDGGTGTNTLFPDRLAGDSDDDGDVDGFDFLNWQRNFGTTLGGTVDDGDVDANGAVDGEDLGIWEVQFGIGPTPLVAAVTVTSEQVTANSHQETQIATLTIEPLSAELVDAAIAMDQTLRSGSGARFGSHATLREDHFDWVSQRARWAQQPRWQGISEIADHSFRGQFSKVNEGRFYRDADAVNEELLDDLFAEGELTGLL